MHSIFSSKDSIFFANLRGVKWLVIVLICIPRLTMRLRIISYMNFHLCVFFL